MARRARREYGDYARRADYRDDDRPITRGGAYPYGGLRHRDGRYGDERWREERAYLRSDGRALKGRLRQLLAG